MNGIMEGEGSYVYSNGDMYSGSWLAGKKHGKGTYITKVTSSKLVGSWKDGLIMEGKWIHSDGSFYEGNFKDNKPIGSGSFSFTNGSKVEGEYVEKPLKEDILKQMLIWTQESY